MLDKIEKNYGKFFKIGSAILFVVGFFYFLTAVILHNILEYGDKTYFGQFFLSFKYLSIWIDTVFVIYCFLRCILIPVLMYKKAFFEEEDDEDLGKYTLGLSKSILYIQVSLVYPYGFLAFTLFMCLYLVNPAFVIRRCEGDAFSVPDYLRHLLHTSLIVFIIFDLILTKRKYPKDRFCMAVLIIFGLIFIVWIHIIHAVTSKWPHHVLGTLSTGVRWLFIIGMFTPAPIFFYTAKILDYILWRKFEDKEETNIPKPPIKK